MSTDRTEAYYTDPDPIQHSAVGPYFSRFVHNVECFIIISACLVSMKKETSDSIVKARKLRCTVVGYNRIVVWGGYYNMH